MENIKLENFRCYSDITISFKKGINLLIGDNASGKTSILKACKYILSAFFAGFSDENTKWENPLNSDFQEIEIDGIILPERPISIYFNINDLFDSNQSRDLFIFDDSFYLRKNSKKNSRSLSEGIRKYKIFTKDLQNTFFDYTNRKQTKALPVFACFSTEDIHTSRKINVSKFKQYNQKNSFGYYECLDGNGFFPYWIKRLLILKEGDKNLEEIEIVRNAIKSVLGENGCNIINDIDIRPNQKKVYYLFNDGREIEAEQLSDGYKRLINIITDLAFRCAILNRSIYGNESCINSIGTVLIDEIDMHLHPSIQSNILKSLQKGFPNMQFIVTSHAPMIMSGVKNDDNNIVYKLTYSHSDGYKINKIDTYGLDLSSISELILNQVPRVKEIDDKLNKLFELIDNENFNEALSLLNNLKSNFGDTIPELSKAEALLNCYI